ncbi:MAG: hypothetical protein CML66_08070 [Rhodobacteraceae bacterium]|nr:hypothetical protein [Paracoccaceae bacterium]MAY47972.1 hypothetical protein [Paracoccaceae bacterium]QEW22564.1 hypothetical protein LA6_004796 [Marinibacterium anthonyi]
MPNILLILLGIGLALLVAHLRQRYASFAAQTPGDYDGTGPRIDLPTHLNGEIICDGVIYGPLGRVVSRFTGDFRVDWTGETAVMREHFRYDDGSFRDRRWQLRLIDGNRIEALADDVIGTGRGVIGGPSLQLRYRIRLPDSSGGHVLDTVDWMYLTPDGTIVNRSQFRKFGITVAELVATMRPRPAEAKASTGTEAA